MAWNPNIYFDPDFLKTYEGKGQAVHITESLKAAADIQVIVVPAE